MNTPERAHLESELWDLADVEALRFFASSLAHDKAIRDDDLPKNIEVFRRFSRRQRAPELQPAIDFNLGIVYVQAAMAAEDDGETALKAKYMSAAQPLFRSLGWQDRSEETLKSMAKREPLPLNPLAPEEAWGR
ncbi:MAG: hypothetical protein ACLP3K_16440 [Candidatus Acidiferrales bacterium]